jgi:hypothetical protein
MEIDVSIYRGRAFQFSNRSWRAMTATKASHIRRQALLITGGLRSRSSAVRQVEGLREC